MHKKYVFDPYPLQTTMQRLAENLKTRRLEKKLSTKSLAEMSGVPASSIQRFELKHSISLESYVKLAKALGYSEEIMGTDTVWFLVKWEESNTCPAIFFEAIVKFYILLKTTRHNSQNMVSKK